MSSSLSLVSSLSPPSLLCSPFSILPPELTQLIIEHTVPLTFQTSTYQSRQSTLRSLCLVSKSFHHFARPLLFATVWIKPYSDHEGWKVTHARGDDKLWCRELIFDETSLLDVDLAGYAGLRTLVISGRVASALDLSILGQLPHLSVLRLSSIDLSAAGEFSLPKLYELSLFQIESFTDHAHILDPRTLPSLRLFAYYHANDLLPGVEQGIARLLHQLDSFSLDYHLIGSMNPELVKKLDPITLFDTDVEELEDLEEKIQVSHLRVGNSFDGSEDCEEVKQLLSQAQPSLMSTIYLPLSASPVAPGKDEDVSKRLELLEYFTARGTEVIDRAMPGQWYLNFGFSEHFLDKMRGERRKQQGKVMEHLGMLS